MARADIEQRLDGPDLPIELVPLWDIWCDLQGSRPSTGFGMGLLEYAEIETYARLVGITLSPWELGTIKAADYAWMTSYATQQKKAKGGT